MKVSTISETDSVREPKLRGVDSDTKEFVAMSKFVVANGMTSAVKNAFKQRPHIVDDAPGFIRMDVISPVDQPDEIWLITYWEDEKSYRQWHRSHHYKNAHKGIPRGLKLDPKATQIKFFEHICS